MENALLERGSKVVSFQCKLTWCNWKLQSTEFCSACWAMPARRVGVCNKNWYLLLEQDLHSSLLHPILQHPSMTMESLQGCQLGWFEGLVPVKVPHWRSMQVRHVQTSPRNQPLPRPFAGREFHMLGWTLNSPAMPWWSQNHAIVNGGQLLHLITIKSMCIVEAEEEKSPVLCHATLYLQTNRTWQEQHSTSNFPYTILNLTFLPASSNAMGYNSSVMPHATSQETLYTALQEGGLPCTEPYLVKWSLLPCKTLLGQHFQSRQPKLWQKYSTLLFVHFTNDTDPLLMH